MSAPDIAEVRAQFPSAARAIHFDHASVGPISLAASAAMQEAAIVQAEEGFQHSWRDDLERVRGQVAWLVGSRAERIAFVQNTSFGISLAATGLDWREGDNVVLAEREFPSNYYPWMNLAALGVQLRKVPAPLGHAASDDLIEAIDTRTRVLAVSAVQFSNGFRYDLQRLGAACAERGVLFVVDGTQSVGALTIDVEAQGIDLLAVSAHKWMLSPPGIGFAHLSDKAMSVLRPTVVGWLSVADPFAFDYQMQLLPTADRFEPGTENIVGTLGLGGAISLLQRYSPQWVEARVLELTDHMCDALLASGCRIISPREGRERSGIVIFTRDGTAPEVLYERLTAAGVKCAARGGGIRFSPHFYNTTDEVDAALAAIAG